LDNPVGYSEEGLSMSERIASPLRLQRPAWVNEFRDFIMRGNVVDLAIGVIIGSAFTGIVQGLVKDIFTPVIGFLSGGNRFNNIFITLAGPKAATLADAEKAGAVTLNIGVFLETVIQFLIVSFVMFWLVKGMAYLYRRPTAAPPQSPPKSEVLLEEIRDILAEKRT
jgi:large conductance mechanosensitive channel